MNKTDRLSAREFLVLGAKPAKKRAKYGSRKVSVPAGKFDSEGEYKHYLNLRLLEQAGLITGLKRQVVYELAPSVILNGRKKPALRMIVDFQYSQGDRVRVEDFKSPATITETYRVKKHLLKAIYNIEVQEIMNGKPSKPKSRSKAAAAVEPRPAPRARQAGKAAG